MQVDRADKFETEVRKIRDSSLKEKVKKQIEKVVNEPNVGKPLRFQYKGERTVYVKPYRLIYSWDGEKLTFLRFEHGEKEVY
ncbi:MAG: plasmid stabilization system [Candidatus Parvarchaeum acidophilus ARMAN-5]|jgi:mRNA-degrading endonuclease RelE of RelBE toxin-antitoxin system|uniref:Plasmid stabilization system n=1 Tax=Candidatus Parvarchaeum acidophilus ARMAN-5 TaxID=662762 RepID=D6GWM8_PARA5|nr:MAG: plasmid stabilization system [Candidatus Parvarchaeum acidophilus ARMAN-5]